MDSDKLSPNGLQSLGNEEVISGLSLNAYSLMRFRRLKSCSLFTGTGYPLREKTQRTSICFVFCSMQATANQTITVVGAMDVVIRTISDKADGSAHLSYDEMERIAAENSSAITLDMLKKMAK